MSLLVQSEVQGLLDKLLGDTGRLRKGNNLTYRCPFCQHRKRKFEVCVDPPFMWACWVCHESGKSIKYLCKKMNASPAIFRELEKIGIKEHAHVEKKEDESEALKLPPDFKSLANDDGSREYREARRYSIKRGITPYDVIKYNLGYCTQGRWKNRIIFPSYDKDNNLNFFTGRSYYDNVYLKYDNCDADRDLIAFENMVDFNFPINLVEGPLDAIAVKRNVIPLLGSYLSPKLKMILAMQKPETNIILDPDAVKYALEIAEFLLSNDIKTKLVMVGKKDDPKIDAGKLGFEKVTKLVKETEYLDFGGIMKLRLGF